MTRLARAVSRLGAVVCAIAIPVAAAPPAAPAAVSVSPNRVVELPEVVVAASDSARLKIYETTLGEAVAVGSASVEFTVAGSGAPPAPTIQAHVEGPSGGNVEVSRRRGPAERDRQVISQYRWSPFSLSPTHECAGTLHVVNRSDRPIRVTPWLIDTGEAPLAIMTETIEPGCGLPITLESVPRGRLKCIRGAVELRTEGGESAHDLVAFVQARDYLDFGVRYDLPLEPVRRGRSGVIHTSALRVVGEDRTEISVRNNAAAVVRLEPRIHLDGAPAEVIAPTLYLSWSPPIPADDVIGYRVYRRDGCAGPPCDSWVRLTDPPVVEPRYADPTVAYESLYDYAVASVDRNLIEGELSDPVHGALRADHKGQYERWIAHFDYSSFEDASVRLRNTRNGGILVRLHYLASDGSELGMCEVDLPPNRATVASARACLEPIVGPAAAGSIRIAYTGGEDALVADALVAGPSWPDVERRVQLPATARWRGTHPGYSDGPSFQINRRMQTDTTLYLQNLDDVETVVTPRYCAYNLIRTGWTTCDGAPVVLPPRGSARVSAMVNSVGCLDDQAYLGSVSLTSVWTIPNVPPDAESHINAHLNVSLRGQSRFYPRERQVATLYESLAAATVLEPGNAVAIDPVSPYDRLGQPAAVLYYQLDDGFGGPAVIRLVAEGSGVRLHF